MYTQCSLRNKNAIEMAWIPAKFAKEGNKLKIKNNRIWEEGWEVMRVYKSMPKKWIEEVESRQYKEMRKVTDI